jgi:site-specific recombinase XerC
MTALLSFAPLLERFFTQRLIQQRQVSPHTISSYRDTFRQFLKFTQQRLHKPPSALRFEEIDAPLVVAFLDHIEKHQGLSARSRNLRSPSPANASHARSSVSLCVKKSMLCSLLPIGAPGSGGAITRLF